MTAPTKNTINVRHTAKVVVTIKSGNRILQRDTIEARLLDAHLMVQSYCRGGAFGQANWRDPEGRPLRHAPKVTVDLADPSDVLQPGQECDCSECLGCDCNGDGCERCHGSES